MYRPTALQQAVYTALIFTNTKITSQSTICFQIYYGTTVVTYSHIQPSNILFLPPNETSLSFRQKHTSK